MLKSTTNYIDRLVDEATSIQLNENYDFESDIKRIDDAARREIARNRLNATNIKCDRLLLKMGLPAFCSKATLNDYENHPDMKSAYQTVKQYAELFSKARQQAAGLIIRGAPGVGKTHIACALANQLLAKHYTVIYVPIKIVFGKLRSTYSEKSEANFSEEEYLEILAKPDLLIVDDIGEQKGGSFEKNVMHDIVSRRVFDNKPTTILTTFSIAQLTSFLSPSTIDCLTGNGSIDLYLKGRSFRRNRESILQNTPADDFGFDEAVS